MNHNIILRFALIAMLFIPLVLVAQIPNAGFESWTDINPDDWLTNNTGLVNPITKSENAHTGSYAARGEVLTYLEFPYPPTLFAGEDAVGFPVDQRYESLNGYYQFSPVGGDSLNIQVYMYTNFQYVGGGFANFGATGTGYSQFNLPIEYVVPDTPDTCLIYVYVFNLQTDIPHIGSVFLLDDLSLGSATSVADEIFEQVPESFSLDQNYPNPFNPVTSIKYGIPEASQVKLDIFTEVGELVTTLVNTRQSPGQYIIKWQPEDLASGVYLYRLETNQGVLTRKMIFIK